jgi:hypothetical protein
MSIKPAWHGGSECAPMRDKRQLPPEPCRSHSIFNVVVGACSFFDKYVLQNNTVQAVEMEMRSLRSLKKRNFIHGHRLARKSATSGDGIRFQSAGYRQHCGIKCAQKTDNLG